MRTGILIVFALVLFSFPGEAKAIEPWADLAVNECKQIPEAAGADGIAEPLEGAIFMADTRCTTVAQCRCPYEPACYCTRTQYCLCNINLCCGGANCP
jgi:hypothetical protein